MRLVAHPRRPSKWRQKIANVAIILFACVLFSGLTLLGALRLQPVRIFAVAQVNSGWVGCF